MNWYGSVCYKKDSGEVLDVCAAHGRGGLKMLAMDKNTPETETAIFDISTGLIDTLVVTASDGAWDFLDSPGGRVSEESCRLAKEMVVQRRAKTKRRRFFKAEDVSKIGSDIFAMLICLPVMFFFVNAFVVSILSEL